MIIVALLSECDSRTKAIISRLLLRDAEVGGWVKPRIALCCGAGHWHLFPVTLANR